VRDIAFEKLLTALANRFGLKLLGNNGSQSAYGCDDPDIHLWCWWHELHGPPQLGLLYTGEREQWFIEVSRSFGEYHISGKGFQWPQSVEALNLARHTLAPYLPSQTATT
jgi:hypothetical protein